MAVDRDYILNRMKGKMVTPAEFDFDRLQAPPLYSLLSPDDVSQLHKLATSIRYAAKPIERMEAMDKILRNRGFAKFAGGTNRVVYRFLEDDRFVLKVATDAVGINDNPREFINQQFLKPFVCKVFEVSPCGTVAVVERVLPITSREEFLSIADDVYDLLTQWFLGEYVCDDIGAEFFLNYGLRKNYGPVLLDYPYVYKLDGNKLYCNEINPDGSICEGVIDYDDGFNHLRCTKCGKHYKAMDLARAIENNKIMIKEGGQSKMKVAFGYGDNLVENNNERYLDTSPKLISRKRKNTVPTGNLKVCVTGGNDMMPRVEEISTEQESTLAVEIVRPDCVEEAAPTVPVVDKAEEVFVTGTAVITDNNVEPETETTSASADDESEDIYLTVAQGSVINTDELGDTGYEEDFKCIIVKDEDGEPIYYNGTMIVIDSIDGRDLGDLAILEKEASNKLVETIENLKQNIKDLKDELEENNKALNDANDVMLSFQDKSTKLEEENATLKKRLDNIIKKINEDDSLPFTLNAVGARIQKKKKGNEELEVIDENTEGEDEFDTTSPLIPPVVKEEDLVTLEDVKEDNKEAKEIVVNNVPVGAAPPSGRSRQTKSGTSKRYDPDFYNNANKGSNKKKKR